MQPRKRKVSWEVIFVAAVLTGTIMIGMFFMGVALSDEKVGQLGDRLEQFAIERDAQDLSRRIAANLPRNNCRALNVATRQTIADIARLQRDVEAYDDAQKIGNSEYLRVKKQYTNLLLEYWLTTQDIEEMCGSNIVTVLYIFSSSEQCPRCTDQGAILTKYRQRYDERLLVFPLDATLDMRPVNLIMDSYNVSSYPVIIIEDEYYEGFIGDERMGTILQEHLANITNGTNLTEG